MGEIRCPDLEDRIRLKLPCAKIHYICAPAIQRHSKSGTNFVRIYTPTRDDEGNWISHMVCIRSKCFHLINVDNGRNSMELCEIASRQLASMLCSCDLSCGTATRAFFPKVKVDLKGIDCETIKGGE